MTRFSLSLAAACALASAAFAQEGVPLADQARFLAGMPVRGTALEERAGGEAWATHATAMDKAFNRQEQRQIAHVREWSKANIADSNSTATTYYMFSGPDFLYAHTFFPNSNTYILCGNEPVGNVPDLNKLSPQQIDSGLEGLRQSMKTLLDFHYFITKDMRVDLTRTQINGTLPILLVFLARTGNNVEAIEMVNSPEPGVKITFAGGAGRPQTLYYFKTDLSNGGHNAGFIKWCGGQGPGLSLVKAASYLMHMNEFSRVRTFLLENSSVIIEDDSGIPLRDLTAARYTVRCYGVFQPPITTFAKYLQPDLEQLYRISNPAPLGFGFGYHWQTEYGMLLLATRKE